MTVHCPNITRLVLRGCDWVDPASLDYFSSHYNSKKSPQNMEVGVLVLMLMIVDYFIDNDVCFFIQDVLMNMGKSLRTNLKTRTKAKYRGKDQLYDVLKRKEEQPRRVRTAGAARSKPLVELDLTGCSKLTEASLEAAAAVFKQLEVLRLAAVAAVSDVTMRSLALNLRQLRILDIR